MINKMGIAVGIIIRATSINTLIEGIKQQTVSLADSTIVYQPKDLTYLFRVIMRKNGGWAVQLKPSILVSIVLNPIMLILFIAIPMGFEALGKIVFLIL